MTTRGDLLIGLVDFLDRRGVVYILLGRVSNFPAQVDSDVDLVISGFHPVDFSRLMLEFAGQAGLRCLQVMQHETSCSYVTLSAQNHRIFTFLHPDACGDYRRNGRLWLTEAEMLIGRRRSSNGFWVPADGTSLVYYLIKRLGKGVLASEHLAYIQGLYRSNPQECDTALVKHFGVMADEVREGVLGPGVVDVPLEVVTRFSRQLDALPLRESGLPRVKHRAKDVLRILGRLRRPTGLIIGFLGPDGSGKSTLIEHVSRELRPAFRRYQYFHLRPGAFFGKRQANPTAVRDPHGQVPRSSAASVVKLLVLMADYVIGYGLKVWPLKVRSSLIVFDRYLQDMQADPRRYRWSGPDWLLRTAGRLAPSPDVWVVLDAPAEVLVARKGEVSVEAAQMQRLGYERLVSELDDVICVRTDRSLEDAVFDVLNQIMARLQRRVSADWGG